MSDPNPVFPDRLRPDVGYGGRPRQTGNGQIAAKKLIVCLKISRSPPRPESKPAPSASPSSSPSLPESLAPSQSPASSSSSELSEAEPDAEAKAEAVAEAEAEADSKAARSTSSLDICGLLLIVAIILICVLLIIGILASVSFFSAPAVVSPTAPHPIIDVATSTASLPCLTSQTKGFGRVEFRMAWCSTAAAGRVRETARA